MENRVEDILNGAGLNEVTDINLSVLVGVVENSRALMEFIRGTQRFIKKELETADTTHMHKS